jgi:TctA family transporter
VKLVTIAAIVATSLLLVSCLTPRQAEATQVIQDLYQRGILTREQFEALIAALQPATWVNDMIAIASGLLGGGGAYIATNISRNRARALRGEPVNVPVVHPAQQS